jgi:hypothetical protein
MPAHNAPKAGVARELHGAASQGPKVFPRNPQPQVCEVHVLQRRLAEEHVAIDSARNAAVDEGTDHQHRHKNRELLPLPVIAPAKTASHARSAL